MITNPKKLLLLFIAVFIILPLLALGIYFAFFKSHQSDITTTIDPITGEQIINGNTAPESGGVKDDGGPVFYGTQFVEPLYGDNRVFPSVRNLVLAHEYATAKKIKISPKNIVKDAYNNTETGDGYVKVSFNFYLNENTTQSYRSVTQFNPNSEIIDVLITDPTGKTTANSININGGD